MVGGIVDGLPACDHDPVLIKIIGLVFRNHEIIGYIGPVVFPEPVVLPFANGIFDRKDAFLYGKLQMFAPGPGLKLPGQLIR